MVIQIESTSSRPDIQYSVSSIGIEFKYLSSPSMDMLAKWLSLKATLQNSMIEGYQTMAAENLRLAEEDMPIALETWPKWD